MPPGPAVQGFSKALPALSTMSRSSQSDKEADKDRLPHSPSSERTVGSNTEVTGTEPYYSVPVLQNVLSEGGVTSRLYSVQVMTQSELDYHRQHGASYNQTQSTCGGGAHSSDSRHNDQYPTCDSTSGTSGGQNLSSDNSDAKSENHSRSEKPVNLSFKK